MHQTINHHPGSVQSKHVWLLIFFTTTLHWTVCCFKPTSWKWQHVSGTIFIIQAVFVWKLQPAILDCTICDHNTMHFKFVLFSFWGFWVLKWGFWNTYNQFQNIDSNSYFTLLNKLFMLQEKKTIIHELTWLSLRRDGSLFTYFSGWNTEARQLYPSMREDSLVRHW